MQVHVLRQILSSVLNWQTNQRYIQQGRRLSTQRFLPLGWGDSRGLDWLVYFLWSCLLCGLRFNLGCHITHYWNPDTDRHWTFSCCTRSHRLRNARCYYRFGPPRSVFGFGWLDYCAYFDSHRVHRWLPLFMCLLLLLHLLWWCLERERERSRSSQLWSHWQAYPQQQQQPGYAQPLQKLMAYQFYLSLPMDNMSWGELGSDSQSVIWNGMWLIIKSINGWVNESSSGRLRNLQSLGLALHLDKQASLRYEITSKLPVATWVLGMPRNALWLKLLTYFVSRLWFRVFDFSQRHALTVCLPNSTRATTLARGASSPKFRWIECDFNGTLRDYSARYFWVLAKGFLEG